MEVGRWRLLQLFGSHGRCLLSHGIRAQHRFSCLDPFCPGFRDDQLDKALDLGAVVFRREMFPAGQGSEMHGLRVGIVVFRVGLSRAVQGILASPVAPETLDLVSSREKETGAVHPGPILRMFDETFLGTVGVQTMTNCPYDTQCDYTYSCPELCHFTTDIAP